MWCVGLSWCDITIACHLQMQPSHAAPLSLSVETGDASPAGGSVMETTIVAMEVMN